MKKRILSIIFAICIAAAIVPIMSTTASADTCTCPAKCTDSYKDADCPVCKAGGICESRRDRRIYDDGTGITTQFHLQAALDWKDAAHYLYYFPLDADITVSSNITVPGNADFVLDLNGHTLSGNHVWAIFKVYGKLTIIDTKGGGKLVDAQGAIKIAGGYVLMKGGTIENCTHSGAVLVQSGGTFKMTGGTLKNNIAYVGLLLNGEEYPASICCDSGGGTVVIDGDAQVLCCDQDNCSHFGAVCKATTLYADGGKIKGGIYNDFISDSGIVTGTITSHHTGIGEETVIEGKVLNYGTVSGGTCLGKVENKEGGTISDGTFCSTVTNTGSINGGTFSSEVDNQGTISGGTFSENSVVKNGGIITGGTFASEVENQGTISGGSFAGKVTNAGSIKGGTFHSEVDNQGTISGGTYSETSVVKNAGIITGGTFLGTVESENGTIADSAKVSVRFITETGETLKTVKVLRGQRLALTDLPEIDPTQYGYAKVKYTVGGKEYRDNSEFTDAVWYTEDETWVTVTRISPIAYTITCDLNGGIGRKTYTYTVTDPDFTLQNPTKDGYVFTGWGGTGLEGTNNMTVTIPKGSTGNREYTATYLKRHDEGPMSPNYFYTVVYDTQGGSPVEPKTVGLGDISNVEVLDGVSTARAGYILQWWECGDPIRLQGTTVKYLVDRGRADNGVITLTAVWKAKTEVSFNTAAQEYTYDETGKAFSINGTGFVVTYRQNGNIVEAPVNAGSYDVIITRAEDDIYQAVNVTILGGLVIHPKAVTATISAIPEQTYTGKDIEPEITVSDGTNEIPATYYTVDYADNRNAGTATVTVTARAGGNYTFESVTGTFTIKKKSINPTVAMADYVYGTYPDYPEVNGNEGGGAVSVYYSTYDDIATNTEHRVLLDENFTATTLNVGTYYIVVTVAESRNCTAGTSNVASFKVNANQYAAPAASALSGSAVTISAADRSKTLEYSLNGGGWVSVPALNNNGSFVPAGLAENTGYTLSLRQKASADGNYEASDAVSSFFVAYNANGGTGTVPSGASASSGNSVTVASGDQLRRGNYTFAGWNTKADGTGTAYAAGSAITTGATLYAQWKDIQKPVITGLESNKTYCVDVEFTVSDNDGIASVKAGANELTTTNGKYTLEKGIGTVTVVATDNTGNTAEVTVTVNDGHTDENKDRKCDFCGTVLSSSRPVRPDNNKPNIDVAAPSECKDESPKDHKCDDCGATLSGHSGGTATCTEKAVCEICGKPYGKPDSTNHNLEKIPAKDTTVTETGNNEYWHCKDCGKYFADKNSKNEIKPDDTVTQKLPPEIIEGEGQNVTEGDKKDLTFRSDAAFSDFIRVEVDGKTLDEKNYTVKEGSTVVTLKADYVNTLSAGEHTIGIVSESGTATAAFTVAKVNEPTGSNSNTGSVDNVSKTEDKSMTWLWVALLFISGGLLTVIVVKTVVTESKRRKRNE